MGDFVSDGASFSCSYCSSKLKISVPSSCVTGGSKKIANTSNYIFPPPGGMCFITSSPCVPNVTNLDPGQKPLQIDGKPALGSGCKFLCAQGGIFTVDSSGQTVAKHENVLAEVGIAAGVIAAAIVVPEIILPLLLEAGEGAVVGEGVVGAEVASEVTAAEEATGAAKPPQVGQRRKNWLPDGKKELGPPNGSLERRDPQTGKLIQKRYYDSDGKPLKNIDFGHDHGAGDPHVHDWDYPSLQSPHPARGDGRPVDSDAIIPEDIN